MAMLDTILTKLGKGARPQIEESTPKLKQTKPPILDKGQLEEYITLAKGAGIGTGPDPLIEEFKLFLNKNDLPVFSLHEVIKYMDKKAQEESKGQSGWEWKPLRASDHIKNVRFGTKAENMYLGGGTYHKVAASDFYQGPYEAPKTRTLTFPVGVSGSAPIQQASQSLLLASQMQQAQYFSSIGHNMGGEANLSAIPADSPNSGVYGYDIPLHALKKVDMIAKVFGDKVKIFVSDYTLAPAIEYPDPFLMAVIDNNRLDKGIGRFIIDQWDEPGFGIIQQLA